MSSASTSFLRCSLPARYSILRSFALSTALLLRSLSKTRLTVLEKLSLPAVKQIRGDPSSSQRSEIGTFSKSAA